MLTSEQLAEFHRTGHLTVSDFLTPEAVRKLTDDIVEWENAFLLTLPEDQKAWFLEPGGSKPTLRKLDNPAFHRPVFRQLATDPELLKIVKQIIGPQVHIFFSQLFCKPPAIGGPKPVHQDNFYFGPADTEATLTVWVAIDDATIENGCLFYADGSHTGPVFPHLAPEDQPFNLQIAPDNREQYRMTAAPIRSGGISLHHGNTWHQSSANTSGKSRRAVAFHYLRDHVRLVSPALHYDESVAVKT